MLVLVGGGGTFVSIVIFVLGSEMPVSAGAVLCIMSIEYYVVPCGVMS